MIKIIKFCFRIINFRIFLLLLFLCKRKKVNYHLWHTHTHTHTHTYYSCNIIINWWSQAATSPFINPLSTTTILLRDLFLTFFLATIIISTITVNDCYTFRFTFVWIYVHNAKGHTKSNCTLNECVYTVFII